MKRVFALLLIICIFSGLPISHAIGYAGFQATAKSTELAKDPEITKKEAVELLHCLNIINDSYETFDPNKLLTRADAARMIYIIIKGGYDDGAENFTGQSNTFTDISGHPAEGYINYSFAMGFINGYPDGTFNPNQKVTGYAFMKIALAVIGYDARIEGFEGRNWDQKVISSALTSGIIKEYKGIPHEPIKAMDAVLILYNTLFAQTVEYTRSGEAQKTNSTVADTMFGLRTYSGILWATDQAALGMAPMKDDRRSWIDLNGDGQFDRNSEAFNISADTGLLGRHVNVAVRIKDEKVDGVYGVFATPGITEKMEIDNITAENSSEEVLYFYNFEADADNDDDGIMDGFSRATYVEYVDNNGDGKCDIVLSWTYKFAKVSSISFDEKQLSVLFSIYGSDYKLNVQEYSGLSNVNESDRIVYLEGNSSMKKGIVKKINPIKGSITRFDSELVYFNNKAYKYSQIEGAIETRPGFSIIDLHVGKPALLYSYNGEVLEIAPIVEANAYEGYAYIFQIEYVDTRNQWTEDEIYDRSYITKVVFEDGQVDTYRIREVDGVLLPGSTDLDATPPQGLYRCKINSFNQLEMITVHRTAMSQSR